MAADMFAAIAEAGGYGLPRAHWQQLANMVSAFHAWGDYLRAGGADFAALMRLRAEHAHWFGVVSGVVSAGAEMTDEGWEVFRQLGEAEPSQRHFLGA